MTVPLELVDPLRYPGWDELVLATSGHSVFHTSSWACVLRDSYGYRPCYLVLVGDGRLRVLMPFMEVRSFLTGRRGVSLPFTDYCDPVLDASVRMPQVLETMQRHGRNAGWRYLEIRGGDEGFDRAPCASWFCRHDLDLSPGRDRLYRGVKNSVRRNIRKAEREGVVIGTGSGPDAMGDYYRLHCLTRRRHGLPPQPLRFFLHLHRHLIARGMGRVMLARHRGRTIAGAVFLECGKDVTYKYGASDEHSLSVRPNDLLFWSAIGRYADAGFSRFSFGRTDLDDEGLLRFKRGWGAAESRVAYRRYDLRRDRFIAGAGGFRNPAPELLGRLPVPVLRLAGAVFYRHMA